MRVSRQLLILTLLAAALCSDRDAALAGTPAQSRSVPTHGLIQRLSAQLRKVMHSRKMQVEQTVALNSPAIRLIALDHSAHAPITLQSWLLNLPPPTAC